MQSFANVWEAAGHVTALYVTAVLTMIFKASKRRNPGVLINRQGAEGHLEPPLSMVGLANESTEKTKNRGETKTCLPN